MKTKFFLGLTISVLMFVNNSYSQKGKFGNTPEDSVKCLDNISVFESYVSQNNLDEALQPWRYCFLNCPESRQNIYKYGVSIVKNEISKAKEKEIKDKYFDTLMMVYDARIKYFGDHKTYGKGYLLGRKGVDYYEYNPSDNNTVYNILKESVEIENVQSKADVLDIFFAVSKVMLENNTITKEQFLETYNLIGDAIDYNIDHPNIYVKSGVATAEDTIKYTKPYRDLSNNCWRRVSEIVECKDLEALYSSKIDTKKEDSKYLRMVLKFLDLKECTSTPLFKTSVEYLHKLEPSDNTAYLLGKLSYESKNYSEAINYLNQAITKTESDLLKGKAYLLMGHAQKNMGQLSNARNSATRAMKYLPENGQPYVLIAITHASSGSSCLEKEMDKVAVYWVAVDVLYKAKAIDSNIDVEGLIRSYAGRFPNKEELFFNGLKEGDSYFVQCLNASTKVRTR